MLLQRTSFGIPDEAITYTYDTIPYPDEINFCLETDDSIRSYYLAETITFFRVQRGYDHVMYWKLCDV